MSAMKAMAMSPDGVYAAEQGVERARARFNAVVAAAALAMPRVDADTLNDLTFAATRALGEAYEVLAVARGYDDAYQMVAYAPRR